MANPIKQLIKMNNAENYPVSPVKAGGGADLPAVTDADNGKVLSVNNGVWGVSSTAVVPTEQIIAPEQTVTITDEFVEVVLAAGVNPPVELPNDWNVAINGNKATYALGVGGARYVYADDLEYSLALGDGELIAFARKHDGQSVPATFTVSVKKTGASPVGPLFVHFTGDGTNDPLTCDFTVDELRDAARDGRDFVFLYYINGLGESIVASRFYVAPSEPEAKKAPMLRAGGGGTSYVRVEFVLLNTNRYTQHTVKESVGVWGVTKTQFTFALQS